ARTTPNAGPSWSTRWSPNASRSEEWNGDGRRGRSSSGPQAVPAVAGVGRGGGPGDRGLPGPGPRRAAGPVGGRLELLGVSVEIGGSWRVRAAEPAEMGGGRRRLGRFRPPLAVGTGPARSSAGRVRRAAGGRGGADGAGQRRRERLPGGRTPWWARLGGAGLRAGRLARLATGEPRLTCGCLAGP